jgi:ubiquinone/menaquinone biosynthesis C-methylase UbiE
MDFVRTRKDYTREALNNPATFAVIGQVQGLQVLDLACGEGYNTRLLAQRGAQVTGVDFSERMIEAARQEEAQVPLGIQYHVRDAACLTGLKDDTFDLVTCFMALPDIEHYTEAVSEVARVLQPRGRFVFSIPHPCFETITVNGRKIAAATRYFETGPYPIHWNMDRLTTPFETITFHRTLTDYFEALHRSRLYVARLVESRLTEQAAEAYPYLQDARHRPQSAIIEAVKPLK